MSELWMALYAAIMLVVLGILALPEGGVFWGVRIPAWCEALLIFCGIYLGFLSIQGILRRKKESEKYGYSEADIAKAKAELDRMYLKKYGKLPERPPESQKEAQESESGTAKAKPES